MHANLPPGFLAWLYKHTGLGMSSLLRLAIGPFSSGQGLLLLLLLLLLLFFFWGGGGKESNFEL